LAHHRKLGDGKTAEIVEKFVGKGKEIGVTENYEPNLLPR